MARSPDDLARLVRELCRLPAETEWVEFKESFAESEDIGEYISALANSAALLGRPQAFLVWGVNDKSHEIAGTAFVPVAARVGAEELENWLLRLLSPRLDVRFHETEMDGVRVVVLEVPSAFAQPVRFKGEEFIRVGSYKKKLKDFPEKERALWRSFDRTPFELRVAVENLPSEDVLRLLDFSAYFELLNQPIPEGHAAILGALTADRMVERTASGRWDISNLGAILLARRLTDFPSLERKAVRVIQYQGNSRITTEKEQVGAKGYASGFEGLVGYVDALLPSAEEIGPAFRTIVRMYPEVAIRELVANAVIHQDLSVMGAGPMVEIFETRVEITSPGNPLVEPDRFLDKQPQSRNERLASSMRRFNICEERGSGVDKVVLSIEEEHLPAPLFEVTDSGTRVVLFSRRQLGGMERADRIRACYFHACLRYVNREFLTNASLRQRFGVDPQNIATVSRYIREAVEAGVIAPYDETTGPRYMKYVPYWARPSSS